ncbi:MAG: CapA family protein [Oscillospiraceae bacterium]|nr:CapA family protein [Oscillospiraceae bacterium]
MSKKNPSNHTGLKVVLILLILVMIAATGFMVWLCIDLVNKTPEPELSTSPAVVLPTEAPTTATEETLPPETIPPKDPERVVTTATVSVQGDLLMHQPVFITCQQKDGSFNFESIFRYCKDLISSFDYAIANLETTFGGDKYKYQGNPEFNCPDPLAQSVADAGYDMLLTANNHAADTRADGIVRTVEVVRAAGLDTLGTQLNGDELKYSIVDINGIRIGMVCYTYAYSHNGNNFSLNGLAAIPDVGTVNFFMNNNLPKLYSEVETIMADMKAAGAEATMMFIHWGVEYQTTENSTQNAIAQKMCDIGFDVVVGGHPHVVQPMDLLESTVDPNHKPVVIYSLGNAVSNQRTGYSNLFPAGYTEDGVLFTVTFEKYTDGKVYLAGTEAIPTWVNMHTTDGVKEYNILPLVDAQRDQWREMYKLNDNTMSFCEKSYNRTMGIVGEGMELCQAYLAQAKLDRDALYADMAANPGNYVSDAPTQTVPTETAPEGTYPAAA